MGCNVKLKDPRTCRIFFSSPFGGMEEEREELTKKFFPQIHHACNAKGIKFVPVDMRWGITKEAAENAQVMNICLREVARSDFFVGFFGQRYGWHSAHSDDSILLENFEKAMEIYPWVDEFKDRSMTEVEVRAGHLNDPGAMPTCFCFRDKEYDDYKKMEGERNQNSNEVMKFTIENEHADVMRSNLIQEIEDTQDKTWGVKLNCKNPQEMAQFIFDTLWKYLTEVVLVDMNEVEVPYMVQQRLVHDQFVTSASHIYCGCEEYLDQLMGKINGPPLKGTVVTGPAGCGKSALLARWMQLIQQTQPYVHVIYHFIGCAPGTERPRNILERMLLELRDAFPQFKSKTPAPDDTGKDRDGDSKEASNKTQAENDPKLTESAGSDQTAEKKENDNTQDEDGKDENSNNKVVDSQNPASVEENTVQGTLGSMISNSIPIDSVIDDRIATNICIVPRMAADAKLEGDQIPPKEDDTTNSFGSAIEEDKTDSEGKKEPEKNSSLSNDNNSGDQKEEGKEKKSGLEKKSTQQILTEVTLLMKRITEEGHKVVILLDALNQQKVQDKTIKHLYWLPEAFPEGVTFVCSTLDTDTASHELLISQRDMDKLVINPFDSQLQEKICVETLKVAGKELSPHQLERVINAKETSNALFLKLVLYELSIYGSFSKLDEKINSLIYVSGVKPLLQVILERLEQDYYSDDYQGNLVKDVLCCLIASRKGLSETELTEILSVPTHLWSPLFFALEHLLSQYTGLLGFAFSEMREAVVERYLADKDQIVQYKRRLIKYFDSIRKTMKGWLKNIKPENNRVTQELPWLQIDTKDQEGLVQTLSDLSILRKMASNNLSELLFLWQQTNLPWSAVSNLYMSGFDKAVSDLYQEMQEGVLEDTESPGMKIRVTLQHMRVFFSEAYYAWGSQRAMEREVRVLETCKSSMTEEKRAEYLRDARYYLAMSYADQQDVKRALPMYMAIYDECEKMTKENENVKEEVKEMLAFSSNGIGLIHYHQKDHVQAEKFLQMSKKMHKEMKNKMHEGASTTNLGLVNLDEKKFNKALEYFNEAKQLYEDHFFGKISIDIGNLYTNIALTHRRMKNLNKAEEFYHKSLEMKAMNVGWNHPVIATAYMNLGTLEVFRKNYAKAEEWTRKAISIYETNEFPKTDRSHRMCRENLCVNMLKQGNKAKVLPLYREITHIMVDNHWVDECIVSLHREMLEYMLDRNMYTEVEKFTLAILQSSKRRGRFAHILADLDSRRPPQTPRPPELTLEAFMMEYPRENTLKLLHVNTVLAKSNSVEEIIETCHYLHDAERDLKETAYSFPVEKLLEYKFPESAWKIIELGFQKYPDHPELADSALATLLALERTEELLRYLPFVLDASMESVTENTLLEVGNKLDKTHPLLAGKCFRKLATESDVQRFKKEGQNKLDQLFPDGMPPDSEEANATTQESAPLNDKVASDDKAPFENPSDGSPVTSQQGVEDVQDKAPPSSDTTLAPVDEQLVLPSHQAVSESQNNAVLSHLLLAHQGVSESQNNAIPSQVFLAHQGVSESQNNAIPSQMFLAHQGVSESQNNTIPSQMFLAHQGVSESQNNAIPSHMFLAHQAASESQNNAIPSDTATALSDPLLLPHQAASESQNNGTL